MNRQELLKTTQIALLDAADAEHLAEYFFAHLALFDTLADADFGDASAPEKLPPPRSHLRPDEPEKSAQPHGEARDLYFDQAPEVQERFFKIPNVL
ncbi:MAG: hypothetical protein M0R76_10035 [Proteobacteria bacterium]|nr:hypothetical protein [Pseudomonadota bacterium]